MTHRAKGFSFVDDASPDDVSFDCEEEITAKDGTNMKAKVIKIINKFILTYFINESYEIIKYKVDYF